MPVYQGKFNCDSKVINISLKLINQNAKASMQRKAFLEFLSKAKSKNLIDYF